LEVWGALSAFAQCTGSSDTHLTLARPLMWGVFVAASRVPTIPNYLERHVSLDDDDMGIAAAIRDAVAGRL